MASPCSTPKPIASSYKLQRANLKIAQLISQLDKSSAISETVMIEMRNIRGAFLSRKITAEKCGVINKSSKQQPPV